VKRPAYQFYPSDERNDLALRTCSIGARGLWQELKNTMHAGTPYGHLAINGVAMSDEESALHANVPMKEYKRLLAELERRNIFSRTEAGVIYSRRMVRDEDRRQRSAEGGASNSKGGTDAPPKKRTGAVGSLFNFLLERYGGCLQCGNAKALELHRILPGRHHGKYEPGNVLLLCRGDHERIEHGEITVAQVLATVGVDTPAALFEGFVHGGFAGYERENRTPSAIPSQIPHAIPSAIGADIPASSSTSSSSASASSGTAEPAVPAVVVSAARMEHCIALTKAANYGLIAVWGNSVEPLLAQSGGTTKALQELGDAGVDLEFARRAVFTIASSLDPAREPPVSLRYFAAATIRRWKAECERARVGDGEAPERFAENGDRRGSAGDTWSDEWAAAEKRILGTDAPAEVTHGA
jgi:hypothetical protein